MRMGVDDDKEVERYRIEDPVTLESANELAEKWLRWGAIWALKTYGRHKGRVSIEDVEQAGRMGVMFASREYSKERGVFPSYAKYFIRNECVKLLARGARPVSMPRDWKETIKPLMAGMDHMRNNGDDPSLEKILNSLDVGETKKTYIRDVYESAGKIGVKFEWSMHAGIEDPDLAEVVDFKDTIERLENEIEKLPFMHKESIVDFMNGVPAKETARRLGVTGQTVGNYRRNSIAWLKYAMGVGRKPREKPACGGIKERIDYGKFA